jgi:hypothetical protein
MSISQEMLDLYDRLIATRPDVRRKGKAMPYTSLNGHMFSFISPTGRLALRLPANDRDAFLARYPASVCQQHGKVLREYVEIPETVLGRVDELNHYFRTSHEYVGSLPPKATTRDK